MIVNKDRMHTYFLCKLLKLHKLFKIALKPDICKYKDTQKGTVGRFRRLLNLANMYQEQLMNFLQPVPKAFANNLQLFAVNVLKFTKIATKNNKLLHRAVDDSFSNDLILCKIRHNTCIRSIIKKLCAKKKIKSKVKKYTILQRKSKYFQVKTNKKSKTLKYIELLLKRKGLNSVPKILTYAVYTYRKILTSIEKEKVDLELMRMKNTNTISLHTSSSFAENNISKNVLHAQRIFRKKIYKLLRRCLKRKEKYYSKKNIKQKDKKLRLYIDKTLESRGFNEIHRNMINNLICKILPLIRVIGNDRLNLKRLQIFIKMILMYKFSEIGSKLHKRSHPEMYTMEYIEAADKIDIDDLDQIINHLRSYIFGSNVEYNIKRKKKHAESTKAMDSTYQISDPDLQRFYKYMLSITRPQTNARWKLRKLILQHGTELKKCGKVHHKTVSGRNKYNAYEDCTESEGTNSVEQLFEFIQQREEELEQPLFRTEAEQMPKPPPKPKNETSPEVVPGTAEITTQAFEECGRDVILPCVPRPIIVKKKPESRSTTKETKFHAVNVNKVYHFKNCLHRGGYGSVNSYYSQILKRDVAIKCISKMKVSVEIFKRFLPRALSLIRQLNHPNIIKYYEVFENGAKLYLVMELAEQGSLSTYIKIRGRLDQLIYHKFLVQIVDAVYYCFQINIFHRKLSCDNILVTKGNSVKLCDFIFARVVDDKRLLETYCGVLAYTAPEILESKPYNPYLTEIWSIGVVTYAMVYGVLPFDSANFTNLLKQVTIQLEFKRYPDTPYAVINLMHNMIAPLHRRWDIMMIMNDPWLFKQNTLRDKVEIKQPTEPVKPWKEIKEQILSLKETLEGTILEHIAEFATDSELMKIKKRAAKKNQYIPEKMKWLFQFY